MRFNFADGCRPARVAIASSGLGHVARGIEAWAQDLAGALHRRGVAVTLYKGAGEESQSYERVVACMRRRERWTMWLHRALPAAVAWRVGMASTYEIEQRTFGLGLIRRLRRDKIDLLHVQDPVVAAMTQRAYELGFIKTKTILAHGTQETPQYLERFPHIQHLTEEHKQACTEAGVWKPTWTTIPNFVETERFCPGRDTQLRTELGIPAEAIVVLTSAAIKKSHKRIDYLLREFASVLAQQPAAPVWLVVAGAREADTDELIALGEQLLGKRVRFLVGLTRERMADLYRSADVFVLTSLFEMLPIALLEATASGLPSIVHQHSVLPRVAGKGGTGVDMTRPGELANTLIRFVCEPDLRRVHGSHARENCVEHFGESAVVKAILEYYHNVLSGTCAFLAAPKAAPTLIEHAPHTTRVSVIIPAFNSASWIQQAVASVLSQTHQPTEVIVIDDGSTDETFRHLEQFGDKIRCVRQSNQGVAAARNHGASLASGDVLAFLDADDIWHPRKLEFQVDALNGRADIALIGSSSFAPPAESSPVIADHTYGLTVVNWRDLVVRNRFIASSVMVRRNVFSSLGGFDPSLKGPEDFDLWLRIAERHRVANIELPLVGYRCVPGSLGKQARSMERGLARVMEKVGQRGGWKSHWLLRRKACSLLGFSCAYLHGTSGDHAAACSRLIRSLLMYPLPYRRGDVRVPFARLRLLAMTIKRMLLSGRTNAKQARIA